MNKKENVYETIIRKMNERESFGEIIIRKNFEKLKTPQQKIIESEMRHRQLIAAETGRIIPDKIPDFIGNFNLLANHSGIFEMYIEEKNDKGDFKGIIEDCYGTATFGGHISETKIIFHKHYIPEKSSVNAARGGIIYEGERDFFSGHYSGKFSLNNYPRVKHTFILGQDPSLFPSLPF